MPNDQGFDRRLQTLLREVLDRESGPDPLWAGSPASRLVEELDERRWPGRWPIRILGLAAVLLVGGALAVGALQREDPRPGPVANGWIVFRANGEAGAALEEPDVGRGNGKGDIYIVVEGAGARRIIGDADDGQDQACPVFSPDGARLAYSELDMSTVGSATPPPQPEGASPTLVDPAPDTDGALTWRLHVAALGPGGTPAGTNTLVEVQTASLSCPRWSPDGTRLGYLVATPTDQRQLWIASTDGRTTALGPAVAAGAFDWAPDGSMVGLLDIERLWLVPLSGEPPRSLRIGDASRVSWSPDGTLVALLDGSTLRVVDLDGTTVAQHRLDSSFLGDPGFAWSPDGRWIGWAEADGIVRVTPDGTRTDRRAFDAARLLEDRLDEPLFPPVPSALGWSPDGTQLLLAAGGYDSPGAIVAVPWDSGQAPLVLVGPTYALRGIRADWQQVER